MIGFITMEEHINDLLFFCKDEEEISAILAEFPGNLYLISCFPI